jgi:hypothetical protein
MQLVDKKNTSAKHSLINYHSGSCLQNFRSHAVIVMRVAFAAGDVDNSSLPGSLFHEITRVVVIQYEAMV